MAEDRKFKWNGYAFENRISGEIIPIDEPVIIFRARDHYGLAVLNHYLDLVEDPHHKRAVLHMIQEFEAFKLANPERMKEPGITHDIALPEPTSRCSICGKGQFLSPAGITCPNGHGGAEPLAEDEPRPELQQGPVSIIDGAGVHPSALDRAVEHECRYYGRDQPDPTKRGFTPK